MESMPFQKISPGNVVIGILMFYSLICDFWSWEVHTRVGWQAGSTGSVLLSQL